MMPTIKPKNMTGFSSVDKKKHKTDNQSDEIIKIFGRRIFKVKNIDSLDTVTDEVIDFKNRVPSYIS